MPQFAHKIPDDKQITASYVIQSALVLFSWLGLTIASWTSFYKPTRSGSAEKAKQDERDRLGCGTSVVFRVCTSARRHFPYGKSGDKRGGNRIQGGIYPFLGDGPVEGRPFHLASDAEKGRESSAGCPTMPIRTFPGPVSTFVVRYDLRTNPPESKAYTFAELPLSSLNISSSASVFLLKHSHRTTPNSAGTCPVGWPAWRAD